MAIQLDLEPEVEKRLSVLAAARGVEPAEYAKRAVANAVSILPVSNAPRDRASMEAWIKELTKITEGYTLPYPEGETYSREMMYADQPKVS